MVIFKGAKRIFDKVVKETNASTSQNRVISLYGVTSYEDIAEVAIQVISSFRGEVSTNIKINNLGSLPLKMLNKDGVELLVEDNWVVPNQVYTIMYKNGSFILLSNNIFNITEILTDLTSRVEALEQQIGPEPEPEPTEIQDHYEIEYD